MSSPALILLHGFACLPDMFEELIAPLAARGVSIERPLLPGHGPAPHIPAADGIDAIESIELVDGIAGAEDTGGVEGVKLAEGTGGVEGLKSAERYRTAEGFMSLAGQLADRLIVPRYHLAGYSLGGRVALAMALTRPERCASLTLISAATGIADEDARAQRRSWDEQQAAQLLSQGVSRFMRDWEELPIFASQQRLPAAVRERIRTQRNAHTAVGLAWAMRVLGQGNMPALAPRLGELQMPITLLTGALDVRYTQMAEQLQRQYPTIHHHIVADAGHNLVVEAPERVRELLSSLPS